MRPGPPACGSRRGPELSTNRLQPHGRDWRRPAVASFASCCAVWRSKHIVEIRASRGAWVLPIPEWNVLDYDVLIALMPTPSSATILSHYLECRRILETESAALAAQRASGNDLRCMADALAEMSVTAASSRNDPAQTHGFIPQTSRSTERSSRRQATRSCRGSSNRFSRQWRHCDRNSRCTRAPCQTDGARAQEILAAIADRDPNRARLAMAAHGRGLPAGVSLAPERDAVDADLAEPRVGPRVRPLATRGRDETRTAPCSSAWSPAVATPPSFRHPSGGQSKRLGLAPTTVRMRFGGPRPTDREPCLADCHPGGTGPTSGG